MAYFETNAPGGSGVSITGIDALVNRIRTVCTTLLGSQNWTEIHYDGTAGAIQWMFIAPGLDGTKQIFGGLGSNVDQSMLLRGYFGNYGSDPAWDTNFNVQPTTMSSNVPLWANTMTYWLVADGQHVRAVINAGTVWTCFYLGFYLPYATPTEYPYPMFVAGSSAGNSISATNGHRTLICPADGVCRVFTPLNSVYFVGNKDPGNDNWDNSPNAIMFPFYNGYRFTAGQTQYAAPDGSVALNPLEINIFTNATLEGGLMGQVDGFFSCSGLDYNGDLFEGGTIVSQGGTDYVLFPNISRLSWNEWGAMRLG